MEHLVQDGGSTDGTVEWLKKNAENLKTETLKGDRAQETGDGGQETGGRYVFGFVSGKDAGMYDAINRAWERSTGDVLS